MNARARGDDAVGGASELESLLERGLAGFRTIDRGLALDGRVVAELVGAHDDRLCLVLAVDGTESGTLPRALAALAFGAAHGVTLERHVAARAPWGPGDGERPRAPVRVMLVADRPFPRATLDLLRPLSGPSLWLLERHRLESESGASTFLAFLDRPAVEVPAAGGAPLLREDGGPLQRFLRELPADTAEIARDLARRIARIDPALECEGGEEGLAWFRSGALLCRLEASRGMLEGRLSGMAVPHHIDSPAEADVFVDWVLSVELARAEERPSPSLERADPRRSAAYILTPEEIEAFRD